MWPASPWLRGACEIVIDNDTHAGIWRYIVTHDALEAGAADVARDEESADEPRAFCPLLHLSQNP